MVLEVICCAHWQNSFIALRHAGLQVNLYDDDVIISTNQGRQLFADAEIGLTKAVTLTNRNNCFFEMNWKVIT